MGFKSKIQTKTPEGQIKDIIVWGELSSTEMKLDQMADILEDNF